MRTVKDITGQHFGLWTALRLVGTRSGNAMWECGCDCGTIGVVAGCALRSGFTNSCGCQANVVPHNLKHGDAANRNEAPEYAVWLGMKQRCENPNASFYDRYGGRGITVCDRWVRGDGALSGYECFISDMGRRPSVKHQIERNNNDLGYFKDNCSWATKIAQMRNRSNTIFVELHGKELPLPEACEILGVEVKRVYSRLSRGWPASRALHEPLHWRGQ